jgi:hypothetical protein
VPREAMCSLRSVQSSGAHPWQSRTTLSSSAKWVAKRTGEIRSGITVITVAEVEAMAFNVDESTALLHSMYPNYPDMRNSRRGPNDLERWLQQYRERMAESEASESSRSS